MNTYQGKKIKGYRWDKLIIGLLIITTVVLIATLPSAEPQREDGTYYKWNGSYYEAK